MKKKKTQTELKTTKPTNQKNTNPKTPNPQNNPPTNKTNKNQNPNPKPEPKNLKERHAKYPKCGLLADNSEFIAKHKMI